MKYIKVFLVFTSCLLVFLLSGCGGTQPGTSPAIFIAAEWNVQALFDGSETGNEYAEYREAAGWTREKYNARLTAISQAIQKMIPDEMNRSLKKEVPDLMGFIEIEHAGILNDLAGGMLSKHGYNWTAFANLPGSSLGIGFMSRYPLEDIKAHSITVDTNTAPRPILELKMIFRSGTARTAVRDANGPGGRLREKSLIFLLCHWKSKLGGDDATEAMRRFSAKVVQRRLRELKETEPETPVIVMGDFNENHDEFFRRSGSIITALLPDDSDASQLVSQLASHSMNDFLILSREKPPHPNYFPDDVPVLYSPWEKELTRGSYYYRDDWETIDHILLSEGFFSGSGWEFSGCHVSNHAPFTLSGGAPNNYVPRNGRGLSDHLPLVLYLCENTGD